MTCITHFFNDSFNGYFTLSAKHFPSCKGHNNEKHSQKPLPRGAYILVGETGSVEISKMRRM